MLSALIALAGAFAYGCSDFIGGVASRRSSVWPVALLACTGAFLGGLVLTLVEPGHPHAADFWWGGLAGIGSGAGTAFLYRGLASGRMGVVAPISAVGAVVLPVVVGVLGGDRPAAVAWIGIVLALPGIWLVSREAETHPDDDPQLGGVVDGLLAGVGFGAMFAAIGQVPAASGYGPLALNQAVSMVAVVACCLVLGGDPRPTRRVELLGLLGGLLATLAALCFLIARHHGLLSIAAVLTSLYPATTVLLASVVLRERIHRAQRWGLALCIITVVCVALG